MKLFSQLILSSSLIFGVCLTQQCLSRSATAEDTLPDQVTSVNQLTDVQPTDWALQALQALVDRYDCIGGYPDQKFQGNRSITRYEFAVGLNACLARLNQLLESTTADVIKREDLQTLQRLQKEFAAELSILRGRVDSLATRTDQFESQQFSTTTKFTGEVVFAVSGAFDDDKAVPAGETPGSRGKVGDNIIFSDRVRLIFNTSFTGQDLLRIRFQAGNIPNFREATGTNMARLSFDSDTGNQLILNQLYYEFPIGSAVKVTAIAQGTLFDVVDTINPLLGSDGRGSISAFGIRSPIYREETGGTGIGISYNFNSAMNLAMVYLANEAYNPTAAGLFDGSYSALAQLTFQPTKSLIFGLTYARSLNAINIGTSSTITNDPFNGASNNIIGNSYSLAASWLINPALRLGGWVGYLQASAQDIPNDPSAEIFYYAVNFGFPDLGKEGNLLGFVFGQPPKVISNEFGVVDRNTSLHFEALYRFQVNDNVSITPGAIAIINPDHNSNNDTIFVGTIRTTFQF
ncbi:iron uptake porin [Nostoc sp. LEGE 12450]|uniref:iron uptake porin n=1 Tax=Nostoc sp. LEGE 12450 TaxID=1828643 RepID=UPI00187F46B7|nr:iron uptake porin [Nostoc sp. LEGE 12450]MBE8989425.1 iron uptake porin [Nostoc sp. LEGE 12450]